MAEAFTCPITQELIKDPVTSKYGHLFEKAAIYEWIAKNHSCPMTNKPLEVTDLFENFAVKAAIQQFIQLNDSINAGTIKVAEESKEGTKANEAFKKMNATMNDLQQKFLENAT